MTTPHQYDNLVGSTAVDSDGSKVGKVSQVFINDLTGEPAWVTVSTGLFGTRESFAPLDGAQPGDRELRLAVPKQLVKDAPSIDTEGQLAGPDVDALYQHYAGYLGQVPAQAAPGDSAYDTGITGQAGDEYAGRDEAGAGYSGTGAAGGTGEYGTSGPAAGDAMTRSEERLHVGTESVPAGRARLRKYVVTENVTQTVPVSHEEVRIEREPITGANREAVLDGPDIGEGQHEVILHEERPVVEKETVPVERVRLGTETVTEQHEVNEQVRKERIEEPDVDADGRRDDRY
jgi:uncharacterized protein (TIGR02271 family)